jgi:hypothetical protein
MVHMQREAVMADATFDNLTVTEILRARSVFLHPSTADSNDLNQATIRIHVRVANIDAGGNGQDGTLNLVKTDGKNVIHMDAGRCI